MTTQPLTPPQDRPLVDALDRLLDRFFPQAGTDPPPRDETALLRPCPGPSLRDWTRRKVPIRP